MTAGEFEKALVMLITKYEYANNNAPISLLYMDIDDKRKALIKNHKEWDGEKFVSAS